MANSFPTLHIKSDSIPVAHYRAVKAIFEGGYDIRTQYDRKDSAGKFVDPPGKDAKVLIEVTNPFTQPRYPFIAHSEIGVYLAEILGVKDHLVLPTEQMLEDIKTKGIIETKWPYTYSQRLTKYPKRDGTTMNQLELMLDKLARDPITRRAVASTAVPEIDNYIKEDLPCLREVQLRLTEEGDVFYLHMDTKWRSRDVFKGWPDNVVALTFLQAKLARDLALKMGKEVRVGSYTDYSSSLHIYGQDISERGVRKFIENHDDEKIRERAWGSEKARELVISQLQDLLRKDEFHFPYSSRHVISGIISDLEQGRYVP